MSYNDNDPIDYDGDDEEDVQGIPSLPLIVHVSKYSIRARQVEEAPAQIFEALAIGKRILASAEDCRSAGIAKSVHRDVDEENVLTGPCTQKGVPLANSAMQPVPLRMV